MIEMRWLTQSGSPEKQKLQYRIVKNYLEMGLHLPIWTEWEDVTSVKEITLHGKAGYGEGNGFVVVVDVGKGFVSGGGGGGHPPIKKKPEKP